MRFPAVLGLALATFFSALPADAKVIKGGPRADMLKGTPKADVFYGYGGNDTLIGGEDILGIGGPNTAYGGKGDDSYRLFGEPGSLKIIENANEGSDTWVPAGFVGLRRTGESTWAESPWVQQTSRGDRRVVLRLPKNVENIRSQVWNGHSAPDTPTANNVYTEIHGSDDANVMTSDDRTDSNDGWIIEQVSHDRIYGYGGDDTFHYGTGNDDYDGGPGWDTLDLRLARVSHLINAEPEFLVHLKGKTLIYGALRNNTWTGFQSKLKNIEQVILSLGIDHVAGSNASEVFIVDQGDRAGGDRIWAGKGNDTLIIRDDFGGYKPMFYYGETGFDTLDLSAFSSPVTIDLASSDTQPLNSGAGIQLLSIEAVYGGNQPDRLSGNSAITEIFRPGQGNDVIKGDNTVMALYTNVDFIYFDTPLNAQTNVDTIVDVKTEADGSRRLEDILYLDHHIFSAILTTPPTGAAYLSADRFKLIGAGGGAVDDDDRILVDGAAGTIFYDLDGSGPAAAVPFARVTAGIAVSASNFATY